MERKPTAGLILFTALFTLGSVIPAYAAEGSSTNTASTASAQLSSLQSVGIPGNDQGHDAGLRPGGNPADPSSLPFAQGNYGQSSSSMQANSLSLAAAAIPARTTYPQTLGTDLVLGKPYQVDIQYPDSFFALTESHFPTTNQLTDGKYGQLTYADHSWQAFYRQYGRTVTVALGQKDNIQALSLDFLEYTAAGITFPDSVTYQVSQDGKNWSTLGTVKDAIGTWSAAPVTQAYQLTGLNINAEYVRAQFSVAVFAFADEFGVFGSTTPNPTGQTPIGEPTPPTQPLGYLPANAPQSGGIHNLLLAYADGNGVSGTWTESDFLPMLQEQPGATGPGAPKGPDGRGSAGQDGPNHKKLFDSVLFLPYGSFANATGLSGFVQNLFTPTIQLAALDQAAAAKGGRPTKVVIAIPGLDNNPTNFGSLTPGGASLDLNPAVVGQTVAYQNKLQVIQWYINQVMTAWKQANFSHLQLAGFYWTPESLNITLEYKHALVEQTAQMVHATGTRFYWIPFYGAYGITEWKQLGFDAVMVQPNVAFNFSIDPASRFASVAQLAQNLGLGVEMELYWGSLSTTNLRLAQLSQDRWDDYLTGGHLFGWEHGTMLSYYDSSKDFLTVADSPSLYYHQVYGNLGTFINRS